MPKVSDELDCFEENFRKRHSRTNVKIDSATVHALHNLREKTKVRVRRFAKRCAVRTGVKVRNVSADCDVRCEGDAVRVSSAEQRKIFVLGIEFDERATHCFAESNVIARTFTRRFIQ